MKDRKYYLDNIRWITVVLVIIYHIIYIFNCSGIITNMDVQGIPILDTFCVFVYPWFMCLLFVISGIASRYSLQKRSSKEFMKDRTKRILIPSIAGIFILGWISGMVTNYYADVFFGNGDKIPRIVKYLIYCLMGVGPLWFCQLLFIANLLLIIIRKIDKNDKLSKLGKKVTPLMLIPMFLLVWGSSFILNTPVITVYRFGIYLLMFLLGYYVFSNEELLEKMGKCAMSLMISTTVIGILYTILVYGQNYASDAVLQHGFTNLYLWIAIISILTFGKKYWNFNNKFSIYMTKNNFNFYILHYPIVLILGFLSVNYCHLPFAFNYIIILAGTIILLPLFTEIIKRIPVVNQLLLGTKNKK